MRKFIAGVVVGIVLSGASVAGAAAVVRGYTWTDDYLSSNGTVTAIWGAIVGQACSAIDTAMGLTPGKCAEVMNPCYAGTVVSLTCGDDGRTYFSMTVKVPGQWTAD